MGKIKQTAIEMEEIVEEHLTGFNDEVQKQSKSLLVDCYYRFGIDQSENPERNEEVFESVVEALEVLKKKITILWTALIVVTAILLSMIVMVAYISTI